LSWLRDSGVYRITHIDSGRYYVGSSKRLQVRLNQHRTQLEAGTHHCAHLQRAWDKYGADSFAFSVLINAKTWDDALDFEQEELDAGFGTDMCFNSSGRARMPILDPAVMARARAKANSSKAYIDSHRRVCVERNSDPEFQARATAALRESKLHQASSRRNAALLQRPEIVAKNRASIRSSGIQAATARAQARRMNSDPDVVRKNRLATSCSVVGVHTVSGEVLRFPSQSAAARHVGVCSSNISMCCAGQINSVKGYRWSKDHGLGVP
jgi:group I intron endonuclease